MIHDLDRNELDEVFKGKLGLMPLGDILSDDHDDDSEGHNNHNHTQITSEPSPSGAILQ